MQLAVHVPRVGASFLVCPSKGLCACRSATLTTYTYIRTCTAWHRHWSEADLRVSGRGEPDGSLYLTKNKKKCAQHSFISVGVLGTRGAATVACDHARTRWCRIGMDTDDGCLATGMALMTCRCRRQLELEVSQPSPPYRYLQAGLGPSPASHPSLPGPFLIPLLPCSPRTSSLDAASASGCFRQRPVPPIASAHPSTLADCESGSQALPALYNHACSDPTPIHHLLQSMCML